MICALFADIHANREALTACLTDAARRGAERYILLGDLVGYGADPEWVVDQSMQLIAKGALAVRGNHDAAASGDPQPMNEVAQAAIQWTIPRLDTAQRDFLARLPLAVEEGERLFVHASAHDPARFPYVLGAREARDSLTATNAQQTFCGHVHVPALYHLSLTGKLIEYTPVTGSPIPLLRGRKWLAVLGAVGQPRDNNNAACYALLDEQQNTLTYLRVPYDIASAARKIRAAGLPELLAARLERGY
ncbi:MAG TPA: metallophosphoesterase family protein [Pseudolabrys sp.]|nr:metallophosphoesterase family protein [Pseudolabrys sp.]